MPSAARLTGTATILLAFAFNVPFAMLGSSFDYPGILRRPAAEVLEKFHAGGAGLVLTWYGFMLSAVFMLPVAAALGAHLPALRRRDALRAIGMFAGLAASLLQAIGLSRWVFVVPDLARIHSDPQSSELARANAQATFDLLNHWGGVAIGEHLGQIFTVLFVLCLAISQIVDSGKLNKAAGSIGILTAALITIGLGEGIMISIAAEPGILGAFSVLGYMAFALWLMVTGASLFRNQPLAT